MSYLNNDVEFIKKPYPKIMKSTLTHADFEKFWHRLYFDINEGFISAAIKRAYRDFNRTIKGMPKEENERHPLRENWVEFLKSSFEVFLKKEFLSQQEFDLWHRDMCEKLENINKDKKVILNVGQAQKWINMTLKYLFLIGENYVEGISKNYKFFHIPLDSIIQTAMNNKYGIQPIPGAWSQITDYDKYLQYQNAIRTKFPNTIPMDEEFKLFNLSYSGSSNNVIPL